MGDLADPKKPGSVLRHRISHHELPGIVCRGFQLHPGRERQGSFGILFEAQRTKDGTWQFGPRWWLSSASASSRWQTLVGQRALRELELDTAAEHGPNYVRFVEQRLQAIVTELEALDIEEKLKTEVRHTRHRQRLRAFELAKARVLEFAGAPDLQMQLAGRQAGFCCNCGKQLTDPISLERGIGPDCYSNKIDFIEAREAGQEPPVNKIVLYSGMPREFVVEVINAMKEHLP